MCECFIELEGSGMLPYGTRKYGVWTNCWVFSVKLCGTYNYHGGFNP